MKKRIAIAFISFFIGGYLLNTSDHQALGGLIVLGALLWTIFFLVLQPLWKLGRKLFKKKHQDPDGGTRPSKSRDTSSSLQSREQSNNVASLPEPQPTPKSNAATERSRHTLLRAGIFLSQALVLGFITMAFISLVTWSNFVELMTKHGLFEFFLTCTFLGSILILFFRKFGPGSTQYDEMKKDISEAMKETKSSKSTNGAKPSNTSNKSSQTSSVTSEQPKKKGKGIVTALSQAAAAQAGYNAVSRPVVIPQNGATVHGASPKGLNQWEIQFTLPGESRVHKRKIGRGATGITHGQYTFKIEWPSIL